MQLTKGLFDNEFELTSGPFGLHNGQMRGGSDKITHNSGWYNKLGEKLGFGDLSGRDFRRIAKNIDEGEVFIVFGEQDSFWHFVTDIGIIGSACKPKPEVSAPGIDYVIEHARYVVVRNHLFRVRQLGDTMDNQVISGAEFETIDRASIKTVVSAFNE